MRVTGRRTDVLAPLAQRLGARVIPADLMERDALHELVTAAGAVDVLVSNAGLPATGDLETFTETEIDRTLDVNLRAPIILARLLAGPMVQRGAPSHGRNGVSPDASTYTAPCSSKRARRSRRPPGPLVTNRRRTDGRIAELAMVPVS